MSLAEQAARKRLILEKQARIKHDPFLDEVFEKQQKNTLLIVALLSSVVFGFLIHIYYIKKYPVVGGEILAASEMTKAEIAALDLGK